MKSVGILPVKAVSFWLLRENLGSVGSSRNGKMAISGLSTEPQLYWDDGSVNHKCLLTVLRGY